jgi:hypothetical protein
MYLIFVVEPEGSMLPVTKPAIWHDLNVIHPKFITFMTFPFSQMINYQALPSKLCMYMLVDLRFMPIILS